MNALNRVVIVVLLFVAMVACSVLLVGGRWAFPLGVQQLSTLVEFVKGREWYELELVGAALACIVNPVLLLFVWLELRQPRKSIRVEKAGGDALVTIASIADRLKHEVGQLPDVRRARPQVLGKRKGVVVGLDVETATGINVPEKANQVIEVTRRVLEEDMGLRLVRPPRVNLRAVSYAKERRSGTKLKELPAVEPATDEPSVEPEDWSLVEPGEPVAQIEPPVELAQELPDSPEEPETDW
jgi:hypothetical protein